MPADRLTGTVAKWLNHKGIGFITPEGVESKEGENNDILVHFEQVKQTTDDGFKSLEQGTTVEYDLKEDPKNPEKKIAVNVTGPDGADCEPKKKSSKGKGKGKGKGKKGKGKKGKGKGKKSSEEGSEEAAEEE